MSRKVIAALVAACSLGLLPAGAAPGEGAVPEGFTATEADDRVRYTATDGLRYAELRLVDPPPQLSTTKECAQYLMDSFQGYNLSPELTLRGFSFQYVDNAPCAGIVNYYDGRSYLLFLSCGQFRKEELIGLYENANATLKLSDRLRRQAHPQSF